MTEVFETMAALPTLVTLQKECCEFPPKDKSRLAKGRSRSASVACRDRCDLHSCRRAAGVLGPKTRYEDALSGACS